MPYRFFKQNSSKAIFALIGYSVGVGSTYLLNNIKDKRDRAKLFLFEPKKLPIDYAHLAPDTSEIRPLQTKRHSGNGATWPIVNCRFMAPLLQ